jgi:hypothetical protein
LSLPALALDLLWKRTRSWKSWQVALLSGAVFVAVLVAVEWPFASFLMTPASANRFFGTMYFDYNSPSWGVDRMRQFWDVQHGLRSFADWRSRRSAARSAPGSGSASGAGCGRSSVEGTSYLRSF